MAAVVPLVQQLYQKLPAMIFNWCREIVEQVAKKLFDTLQESEQHYKNTNPRYLLKVRNYERQQVLLAQHQAARQAALEANQIKQVEAAKQLSRITLDEMYCQSFPPFSLACIICELG